LEGNVSNVMKLTFWSFIKKCDFGLLSSSLIFLCLLLSLFFIFTFSSLLFTAVSFTSSVSSVQFIISLPVPLFLILHLSFLSLLFPLCYSLSLFFSLLSARLEVAANRFLNRLNFMDMHYEHYFASVSDNIRDVKVHTALPPPFVPSVPCYLRCCLVSTSLPSWPSALSLFHSLHHPLSPDRYPPFLILFSPRASWT
jgi:hypothetical protein